MRSILSDVLALALLAREDARDVVRPVADNRHRLARQRREDDLAVFAVGDKLASRRVDDLGDVLVFKDMETAVALAVLASRADAAGLSHAVDVKALDAEALLDAAASLVGERLRAEDADLEVGEVTLALWALVKLFD